MSALIDAPLQNLLNKIQSGKNPNDEMTRLLIETIYKAKDSKTEAMVNKLDGKIALVAAPFLLACSVGLYEVYNHFAADTTKREAAVAANPATTTAAQASCNKNLGHTRPVLTDAGTLQSGRDVDTPYPDIYKNCVKKEKTAIVKEAVSWRSKRDVSIELLSVIFGLAGVGATFYSAPKSFLLARRAKKAAEFYRGNVNKIRAAQNAWRATQRSRLQEQAQGASHKDHPPRAELS